MLFLLVRYDLSSQMLYISLCATPAPDHNFIFLLVVSPFNMSKNLF